MGKKRKHEEDYDEEVDNEKESGSWLDFFGSSSGVRRSVIALLMFALAVFCVLAFVSQAGFVGMYFEQISGLIFGWGKWIVPLVLFLFTWFLLQKNSGLYYVSIVAISFSFLAFLALLHLFIEPELMKEVAQEGRSGGYIGYAIASSMFSLFGLVASSLFLVIFFISGILIAFGVSLIPFFENLSIPFSGKEKKRDDEEQIIQEDQDDDAIEDEEISSQEETDEENIEGVGALEKERSSVIGTMAFDEDYRDKILKNDEDASEKFEEKDGEEEDDEEELYDFQEDRRGTGIVPVRRKKRFKKKQNAWKLPPLKLLEQCSDTADAGDTKRKKEMIVQTFAEFGIAMTPVGEKIGPTVTQYRFRPAPGVRLERITALGNNLSYALAAHSIRVEAPIPGESLVGIEVPNTRSSTVCLRDALQSREFKKFTHDKKLAVVLGKDVAGNFVFDSLASMPHLLVAGATGSGKSVCIHSIITSLLCMHTPDEVKLILVDPKREMMLYQNVPHLKTPVIVEMKKVVGALHWAIEQMEKRYVLFSDARAVDINSYNRMILSGDHEIEEEEDELEPLPSIVIVIDEFSDLMMSHGKQVEGMVVRLAQKGRAAGVHLIIATQRPSVETLTGLIKANIPSRIAFKVATQIDSRTIIDRAGAEKLLGKGDMLYETIGSPRSKRIQGVFITTEEVKDVVEYLVAQAPSEEEWNDEEAELSPDEEVRRNGNEDSGEGHFDDEIDLDAYSDTHEQDEYYDQAKELVISAGEASASMLQRRLGVGYNRAANILEALEVEGIVGPKKGSKPRDVLAGPHAKDSYEEENQKME
jgi:S-DNA-T family DNA segregation ATPase FtsK/SpoIIIE